MGFGSEMFYPYNNASTIKGQGALLTKTIPITVGQRIGIKGMIWKIPSGAHQEIWYDVGHGWQPGGTWDRPNCGKKQTSTSPASNAQVEFRCDCSNVVFSGTDLAAINPPRGGYSYAGELGYIEA